LLRFCWRIKLSVCSKYLERGRCPLFGWELCEDDRLKLRPGIPSSWRSDTISLCRYQFSHRGSILLCKCVLKSICFGVYCMSNWVEPDVGIYAQVTFKIEKIDSAIELNKHSNREWACYSGTKFRTKNYFRIAKFYCYFAKLCYRLSRNNKFCNISRNCLIFHEISEIVIARYDRKWIIRGLFQPMVG
jgi:hypothetical protein